MGTADANGDGFISVEEMLQYLTSVFRVLYASEPGVAERAGVSAEELAESTTLHAFQTADVNGDGLLSFEVWLLLLAWRRCVSSASDHVSCAVDASYAAAAGVF